MKSFVMASAEKVASLTYAPPLALISLSSSVTELDEHHVSLKETPLIRLICGGLAGAIACTACYPIELVKTRLTVDKKKHYRGIFHTFSSVIKNEGFFGLYKGLSSIPLSLSLDHDLIIGDRIESSSRGGHSIDRPLIRLVWHSEIVHPSPQDPIPLQPRH
jgi:hypothetical protein